MTVTTIQVPTGPQVFTISVPGVQGPPGLLRIVGTITGAPGTNASVSSTLAGDGYNELTFTIPRGTAGAGSPPGGTVGQLLTKNSSTDYDVVWASPTDLATASTVVKRDGSGAVKFTTVTASNAPSAIDHLTRKDYVDTSAGRLNAALYNTTTAYTLILADAWRVVMIDNASAITLTVPTNATVAFPIGTVIPVFQYGLGKIAIAGAGVTFEIPSGFTASTSGDNATVYLTKRATDTWVLSGNLLAATPTAAEHLTRKDYVDAVGTNLATGNTIARRDVNGDINFGKVFSSAAPATVDSLARKDYVDTGDKLVAANAQVGTTYTFVLADSTRETDLTNAAAITATVPLNSAVAYPIGTVLIANQIGAGQVTFSPTGGVTLEIPSGYAAKTSGAGATVYLRKRATDTWTLSGGLDAVTPTLINHLTRKDYVDGTTKTASQISDSTTVGRSVITAVDAPAARTAIGAGTSNLALGTTSTTAKAGDYAPPADGAAGVATTRTLGTGATQAAAGNHTHTSTAITDFTEATQDVIGASLVQGSNITIAYDDPSGLTTISTTASAVTYATLPAGTTITVIKSAGVWPARPTARTDIVVAWKGADPSPAIVSSGTGGMMDDVDYRLVTP